MPVSQVEEEVDGEIVVSFSRFSFLRILKVRSAPEGIASFAKI